MFNIMTEARANQFMSLLAAQQSHGFSIVRPEASDSAAVVETGFEFVDAGVGLNLTGPIAFFGNSGPHGAVDLKVLPATKILVKRLFRTN